MNFFFLISTNFHLSVYAWVKLQELQFVNANKLLFPSAEIQYKWSLMEQVL